MNKLLAAFALYRLSLGVPGGFTRFLPLPFLRHEIEGHRVYAIPFPGRLRPVVENMAEMRAAVRALHLHAAHEMAVIFLQRHIALVHDVIEAGPASSGLEFRVR